MLISILWNILTPILLVAATGFWGRRRLGFDSRTLSSAAFYVFTPSLVFRSLFFVEIQPADLARLLGFWLTMSALLIVLALLVARARRWEREMTSAFVLTVVLLNAGNFGIPLNRFAYGDAGAQLAVLYYSLSAIFCNTVGVLIASSGHTDFKVALRGLARTPMIYATAIALLARALHVSLPLPLLRAVELLGDAAVPVMLLLLGMQLSSIEVNRDLGPAWAAVGMRLVLSPLLAVACANWWGLTGMMRAVGVTQWGVPTAVISAVLAAQYNCRPRYVAVVILLTTLLSILTMPLLLNWVAGDALLLASWSSGRP